MIFIRGRKLKTTLLIVFYTINFSILVNTNQGLLTIETCHASSHSPLH